MCPVLSITSNELPSPDSIFTKLLSLLLLAAGELERAFVGRLSIVNCVVLATDETVKFSSAPPVPEARLTASPARIPLPENVKELVSFPFAVPNVKETVSDADAARVKTKVVVFYVGSSILPSYRLSDAQRQTKVIHDSIPKKFFLLKKYKYLT